MFYRLFGTNFFTKLTISRPKPSKDSPNLLYGFINQP